MIYLFGKRAIKYFQFINYAIIILLERLYSGD